MFLILMFSLISIYWKYNAINLIQVFVPLIDVKLCINYLQGLILSLTTQFAWSLLSDSTSQRSPSGQGNLYRSAPIKATQDKDSAAVYAPNQRGSRCIRCGSGATGSNSYYGNSGDR